MRSLQAANSARVHSKRWSGCRQLAGGKRLPADVVLPVGRGDHDGRRPRRVEDVALGGRQARRIEVLDDLDEHRGVVAAQPAVAVGQRALPQLDPVAPRVGQQVELERRAACSRARIETSTPTTSS
jgi:hypothetical protein